MLPPKLPLPALSQTLSKYLIALKPLVGANQFKKTEKIVGEFSSGIGPQLQNYLIRLANEKENWSYEYCKNRLYLDNRASIPYMQNAVGITSQKSFPKMHNMASYVAEVIHATFHQIKMRERKESPQDYWKGRPLCMNQFETMYRCYRIPVKNRDIEKINNDNLEHLILIHKNQIYSLPLTLENGEFPQINKAKISQEILSILESLPSMAPAVGLLTALDRDTWAETRGIMMKDALNAENLLLIETSMMIVCLDEAVAVENNPGKKEKSKRMHQMFHGGGCQFNGGNRWYDKDVQLVVSKDGVVGGISEHTSLDGTTMMRDLNMWELIKENLPNESTERIRGMSTNTRKLEWNLCPQVLQRIKEAEEFVNWTAENLDFINFTYYSYGKDWIKSVKCSPDAYVQLALQLTAYKLYGCFVNSYSSAQLRLFRQGRTEFIRPLTHEMKQWVSGMTDYPDNGSRLNDHVLSLFETAMERQIEITQDANTGKGFDVHLISLCEAAKEVTGTVPQLFQDESYEIANKFMLTTAQVPAANLNCLGCFGPDSKEGFGVCYHFHPDAIDFGISAWISHNNYSSKEFGAVLDQTLNDIRLLTKKRSTT